MVFWKWILIPLELYTPEFIKREILRRLMTISALSFQCPVPKLKGLSAGELLNHYACFTENTIRERLSQNIDCSELKSRLYRNAFQDGQILRDRLGISGHGDAIRWMRFLYRVLKIKMRKDPQTDGIIISQCFFRSYYSGEICQVMGALDQGLAAGLSGGERLEFSERMTEGCDFCRANWRGNLGNGLGKEEDDETRNRCW